MAMTGEHFEALVRRLELLAKDNPKTYRRRVAILAGLGYAYFFVLFGLLLGLIGGLLFLAVTSRAYGVAVKMCLGLLVFTGMMARALWVRMPPPEGLVLEQQHHAALFEAIERARLGAQAPPVHRVLLTNDFNASVTQVPRLGVFGWQRNYLCLGLPLMLVLSSGEFEAVLAHEFGHLSGAHGRFGGWIYRVRETWARFHESAKRSRHWAAFLVTRFLQWYAPYFQAYSFVMARAQEMEADAVAAAVSGPRRLADALVKLDVTGSFLQEVFWPGVIARAEELPLPPPAPLRSLPRSIERDLLPESALRWLERALLAPPSCADTHPSLEQRLAAVGEVPRIPPAAEHSAAEALLGRRYPSLLQELGEAWQREIEVFWRQRHAHFREAKARLADLEKRAQKEPLSANESLDRAIWTEEVHGSDEALPLYQDVLAREAGNAVAHFAIGRIRLSKDDESGIASIQKAMDINADLVLPGCERIYGFLRAKGRLDAAQPYYERGVERQELLDRAGEERSAAEEGANYLPHEIPPEDVRKIREQLARHPEILRAYLARKEVKLLPEHPLYVLAVEKKVRLFKYYRAGHAGETAQKLADEVPFPAQALVVVLGSGNAKLRRKLKRLKGAEIYRKAGRGFKFWRRGRG